MVVDLSLELKRDLGLDQVGARCSRSTGEGGAVAEVVSGGRQRRGGEGLRLLSIWGDASVHANLEGSYLNQLFESIERKMKVKTLPSEASVSDRLLLPPTKCCSSSAHAGHFTLESGHS